ncbi:MAG: BON domain-containing protein [Rhodospirillaceae bacterium]|nr:BON domain-containing protein [Rhodospirillaceae bacterium]MBT6119320.1 BON domain-containing protein [Rhodospirillaceae bacterium]
MGRRNIHPRHLAAAALLAAVLASCSPTGMAVGAGATAVKTAAQERSVEDAIDDNVIAAEINYLWASHDLALFRKLDTSVVEGKVVITGAVLYPQTRVEAIRLAWQADGVKQIVDEIQIEDRGDLIDQARDEWISVRLKGSLLLDSEVSAINYNVTTVNGIVYLSGIARSGQELDRVRNHARHVPRVRGIVTHVRVLEEGAAEAGAS